MLKTSLLIAGDSSSAQKAVGDLAGKVGELSTGARGAAPAMAALDQAQAGVATSAREAATVAGALGTAQREAVAGTRDLASASIAAAQAQASAAAATGKSADAVVHGHTRMSASGAIMQHVVRSTTDSFVAGLPISMIFGEQIGRVGEAAAMSGGALGSVGAFLAGPWGLAVTSAVSIGAVLVGKLLEGGDAAKDQADALDKAVTAADAYGTAQSMLGKVIDLTTGKLTSQNDVLKQTIKLQAQANVLAAQSDRAKLLGKDGPEEKPKADLANPASPTFRETASDLGSIAAHGGLNFGSVVNARIAQLGPLTQSLNTYKQAATDFAAVLDDPRSSPGAIAAAGTKFDASLDRTLGTIGAAAQRAGRDVIDVKRQVLEVGQKLIAQQANMEVVNAIDGKGLSPGLRKDAKAKKPRKPKKSADTTAFTASIGNDIASITAQFTDAPTFVEKARAAVARLDKDIAELQKKKPPNFQTLIDQATAAKGVIQTNIDKPYTDLLKSQQQSFDILTLQAAGLNSQADALKTIQGLERQLGPLDQAHRDGVLATVQALQAEQREVDELRERNAKYVEALGSIKGVVDDATQAFVRGDLGQLMRSPGKLLSAFQTLQGRALFDKIFAGVFTELQDQVNGTSVVKDAASVMAGAVDRTSASIAKLGSVADAVANSAANGNGSAAAMLARGNGAPPAVDLDGNAVQRDVVVTASRDPSTLFANALGKVGTSVASALTNPDTAKHIGSAIGTYSGEALKGAAEGSMVAGVGKALGLNLSQSGAQLGGAVGGILGGIKSVTSALGPLGGAIAPILGLAGGVLGSLFGSTKYGGATITSAGVTGTVGNVQSEKQAATAAVSAVVGSLRGIASQLGGSIGDFGTITVGQYKDKYRVNDHGTNLKSNNDVVEFGTLEEAQAFALQAAITRGAVKGLDTAVAKALQSNASDMNNALQEALGVRQLEYDVKGATGAIDKIFDAEKASAAERLRLAQSYGVSIADVEKLNADNLTKLAAPTLKTATGSLQSVLDDMGSGDLFAGTAADKRKALLGQIDPAKASAAVGDDGAADTLATLYRNLLSTSKDAYGTAGAEYAADRSTVSAGAAEVIKAEQDRINQAAGIQQSIADSTAKTASLTDESNDLLVTNNKLLTSIAASLSAGGSGGDSGTPNYLLTKFGEAA